MNKKFRKTAAVIPIATLLLILTKTAASKTEIQYGYASAYAPGVMTEVVRYRLDNNIWRTPLPYDWYTVHGYIAAMDCSRVGEITTLYDPNDRPHIVLIADCAGDDGPIDRFSRQSIIVELNWELWEKWTAEHGRPLKVGLKENND